MWVTFVSSTLYGLYQYPYRSAQHNMPHNLLLAKTELSRSQIKSMQRHDPFSFHCHFHASHKLSNSHASLASSPLFFGRGKKKETAIIITFVVYWIFDAVSVT